jgi:hypothetical protein
VETDIYYFVIILINKMMRKQENKVIRYVETRPKTLTALTIVTTASLALMSILAPTSEHSVDAQMTMEDHGGFGNMTLGLQGHQQEMTINGTINLEQTIFDAIGSKVNTSLTEAMTIAERSVGNNSFALSAFGGDLDGYFVYRIFLATPGMEFYYVISDPVNGQLLSIEKISREELEKLHLMHIEEHTHNAGNSTVSAYLH